MSKRSQGWWSDLPKSDDEAHHIEDGYAWAYEEDDDEDEDDESYADEDRISSRPWGDNNEGA